MAKPDSGKGRLPGRAACCAIYTRKSSEEGLEQDFNSLHAQREACEAYISSQRHEGWVAVPEGYDDGGISGATMERPALLQLLADIAAGKIDTVIVYKVDRLTRTLSDFAKIVEIFDRHGVAFVSVTQQFNTTSSMGRLTLNMLLSFAQFEREVTGERIRDKIAASKKRGMWMGGNPPLGYDVRDRKLVVNETEAEVVRHVYRRYVALGSVHLLQQELAAEGFASKLWVSATGRRWGGRPLARGALYLMLRNRLYRGEIVHKDQHYRGEHPAIVDEDLWDEAQALLAGNGVERGERGPVKSVSLLSGLLYDGSGRRMTPTHAVKAGRRYRYYISAPLLTAQRRDDTATLRLPAPEIETVVTDRLCRLLADHTAIFDALRHLIADPAMQKRLIDQAEHLAKTWPSLLPQQLRRIVMMLIRRVEARDTDVQIEIMTSRLSEVIGARPSEQREDALSKNNEETLVLVVPIELMRIGYGTKLIVGEASRPAATPNPGLLRLLVKAHQVLHQLMDGSHASIASVAEAEGVTGSYLTRLVRIAWLAPDITQAILVGRQPPGLTPIKLMQSGVLSSDWQEQRVRLGSA